MGNCVSPCSRNQDGVCVIRGTQHSCEGGFGLTLDQLVQLAASADRIRLSPEYLEKFGISMQALRSALSLQESGGVIEITGRSP